MRFRGSVFAAAVLAIVVRGSGGSALADDPAVLQLAPAIVGPSKGLGEEIVVTGSRIRRKDLGTPAPVTVVGREQIHVTGAANVAEYLQLLPEMGNTVNRQGNNNPGPPVSEGANYVGLRSFGANRTLVLMNGRRLAPNGTTADVDLNSIPSGVIERVEILKDGASPIYGADAVAGVVNIITRRKLDATEASAYTGVSGHGDALTYQLDATTGGSGDRWSFLLSLGYSKQGEVWARDRQFSAIPRAYDPVGAFVGAPGEFNFGTGITPQGRVIIPSSQAGVRNGNDLWNRLVTAYPQATSFMPDPSASLGWRPFVPYAIPPVGDAWNYQPENYIVTPLQRISVFGTAEAKLGDRSRAYAELSFVNRTSAQRLAPEPLTIGGAGVDAIVSADNPYNPFGRDFTRFARRLMEFGPRAFSQDVDNLRVVAGLDGTLPQSFGPLHGWFWDVSLNYGKVNGASTQEGMLLAPRVADAVGAGFADPTAPGGYRCGTPGQPIAGCVPLNLFGGAGSVSPDQKAGLTFIGVNRNESEMLSVQLNTSGELFRLAAARPIGLAAGYEFRRVAGAFIPDPVTASGQSSGGMITPARGRYHVNEGYAELSIPIVSGMPFAEDLELLAAARAFKYSTVSGDWTWKLGGRWRPVRDLTVRGTWSTAYRAPSIYELYAGSMSVLLGGFPDPCADLRGATAARVAACGPAGNNGNDSGDLPVKISGNAHLKPETARTVTAGIVLEPRWVPGLSVTADYWDLRLDNVITGNPDIYGLFRACYPSVEGVAPRGCEFIVRDPTTQAIAYVDATNTNYGSERAAGVDLALRYVLPTARAGRFGLTLDATWLRLHDFEMPGMVVHGKGNYDLGTIVGGLGGINPAWKVNLGATWKLGGFGAGVLVRYLGSLTECWAEDGFNGYCSVSDVPPYTGTKYAHEIPAYVTADVMASYDLVSSMGRTSLAVGVRNVFDREPPLVYTTYTNNSDATAYDFVGRYFWLRLTHRL